MNIIQALILGVIQGLTELLPISSSAHLAIIPWMFGWTNSEIFKLDFEAFDVALHFGTLLAIVIFFAKDWIALIKGGYKQVIKKEKERLGVSEGQAVVIVNLYQFESDMEYKAVRILDKIKSDGVYIYPALFDNDGTLNNDLIQDLGELTYGDNN